MGTTFQSAQPYVTGACHILIGRTEPPATPAAGKKKDLGPEYLGTCEFSPRVQIDKVWVPLFNDLGGPAVPFDLSYAGKQAFIALDLTRWNDEVVRRFDAAPLFEQDIPDDLSYVGTLVDTEGYGLTVWCVFPYAKLPAYGTMKSGYRFPMVVGLQTDHNRIGTQPRRIHVNMHAIRHFDAAKKKFTLADYDTTAVQGLFPTP